MPCMTFCCPEEHLKIGSEIKIESFSLRRRIFLLNYLFAFHCNILTLTMHIRTSTQILRSMSSAGFANECVNCY